MLANYVLFFEVFIVLAVCACYFYFNYKEKPLLLLLIECGFLALAVGTPLFFTSITRSVFEVTKMYLLRFVELSIVFLLFISAVIKKPLFDSNQAPDQTRKTLLKISILWIGVNVLSFIFSPNRLVSWIGAYDRWEGLLTVINYMILFYLMINLLKTAKFYYWLIGGLIFSATLTSIYGIYQSTGRDFMNWSVDPTARVFASINNPVHFSAYIAMLVPLCMVAVLFVLKRHSDFFENPFKDVKNRWFLIGTLLILCFLILHYAGNFISFGRATWIGFGTALMFYFYYALKLYHPEKMILSSALFYLGMFLANAFFTFKVQETSTAAMIIIYGLTLIFLAFLFYIYQKQFKKPFSIILVLLFCVFLQFNSVNLWLIISNLIILGILIYLNSKQSDVVFRNYTYLNYFFMFCLMMVLVIPSIKAIYVREIFNARLAGYIKNMETTNQRKATLEEKESARGMVTQQLVTEKKISVTEANIFYRTDTYATHLKLGTARTSMWRSGIGLSLSAFKDPKFPFWLKEHPLVGTGPGTIKVFFPKYRRPEYGRLEGGHNFTPDKLHNDYINLIATNGLIGFSVYYLLFLPFCFFIFHRYLVEENEGEFSKLIAIGAMSGMMVYLGQVMFNFGVVATRVLFYELLAIAMVMIIHRPFSKSETK